MKLFSWSLALFIALLSALWLWPQSNAATTVVEPDLTLNITQIMPSHDTLLPTQERIKAMVVEELLPTHPQPNLDPVRAAYRVHSEPDVIGQAYQPEIQPPINARPPAPELQLMINALITHLSSGLSSQQLAQFQQQAKQFQLPIDWLFISHFLDSSQPVALMYFALSISNEQAMTIKHYEQQSEQFLALLEKCQHCDGAAKLASFLQRELLLQPFHANGYPCYDAHTQIHHPSLSKPKLQALITTLEQCNNQYLQWTADYQQGRLIDDVDKYAAWALAQQANAFSVASKFINEFHMAPKPLMHWFNQHIEHFQGPQNTPTLIDLLAFYGYYIDSQQALYWANKWLPDTWQTDAQMQLVQDAQLKGQQQAIQILHTKTLPNWQAHDSIRDVYPLQDWLNRFHATLTSPLTLAQWQSYFAFEDEATDFWRHVNWVQLLSSDANQQPLSWIQYSQLLNHWQRISKEVQQHYKITLVQPSHWLMQLMLIGNHTQLNAWLAPVLNTTVEPEWHAVTNWIDAQKSH